MISTPTAEIKLRCPACHLYYTQECPTDHKGIIILNNDICPNCGTQTEPSPPEPPP